MDDGMCSCFQQDTKLHLPRLLRFFTVLRPNMITRHFGRQFFCKTWKMHMLKQLVHHQLRVKKLKLFTRNICEVFNGLNNFYLWEGMLWNIYAQIINEKIRSTSKYNFSSSNETTTKNPKCARSPSTNIHPDTNSKLAKLFQGFRKSSEAILILNDKNKIKILLLTTISRPSLTTANG